MRGNLNVRFIEQKIEYRGPELRPHFILSKFGVEGDAIVAWQGKCLVETDHLVDWEDRLAQDRIQAAEMLHFMGEFFQMPLPEAVWLQRNLVQHCADVLNEMTAGGKQRVLRKGDDLFIENRKLSVSIVAPSPAGCVLHLGINIDPTGAPVPAIGLSELAVDPKQFAQKVFLKISEEWASVSRACVKVRPVIG